MANYRSIKFLTETKHISLNNENNWMKIKLYALLNHLLKDNFKFYT